MKKGRIYIKDCKLNFYVMVVNITISEQVFIA